MRIRILPESTIPAVKCGHRFGAKSTFSHQTDSRFIDSIYAAEMYGFKNNIRLGAFVNNTLGQNNQGIGEVEKTGLMRHDIYFGTDKWENPNTGVIETIPDHYSAQWTQLGVDYFENAILGEEKATRFPTCGKSMFDLSNGLYGFDTDTGQMGSTNLREFFGVVEYQNKVIFDECGRLSSAGSYRNGVQGEYSIISTSFLGVRNSHAGGITTDSPSDTYYGFGYGYPNVFRNLREFTRSYPSSTRWWDYWNTWGTPLPTKERATEYLTREIKSSIIMSGWFRDFCHWHSCRNTNTMPSIDEFLNACRIAFENNFVWTCSNGEALEYLYVRELADFISGFEKEGKVFIVVDTVDEFKGTTSLFFPMDTPLQTMFIPLSVEVDLSGSSLSGKSVYSSSGKMINLGNDKYIIQVPFNQREGFKSVEIFESSLGYFNTNKPEFTKIISGNNLTINTNIPTKSVLFSVASGGYDYDSLPELRKNDLSLNHNFVLGNNKDYRVGLISEFGQSILIDI